MRIKPDFRRGDSLKPIHDETDQFRRKKLQPLIAEFEQDFETAHDMQRVLYGLAWGIDLQLNGLQFAEEKAAEDERLELMAWRSRNLMEFLVFTKWVTKSRGNAERFAKDWVSDGIGIFEALRDWQNRTAKKKLSATDHPNPQLKRLYEERDKFKLGKSFIQVRDAAKEVGLGDEYSELNKFYSKLVHPTAWSILRMHKKVDPAGLGYFLFFRGLTYALDSYEILAKQFSKRGFEFPLGSS